MAPTLEHSTTIDPSQTQWLTHLWTHITGGYTSTPSTTKKSKWNKKSATPVGNPKVFPISELGLLPAFMILRWNLPNVCLIGGDELGTGIF